MNGLFPKPWDEKGYADIVGAGIVRDDLRVEFANGDVVVLPFRRLGVLEPSRAEIVDDGLGVLVVAGGRPVNVSWTQIRAASDADFAHEMRRRDSEEARRIGMRLKALREDKGISQRHLAEQVAMPPAQLAKIESGTYDLRMSTVSSLLRAMGASLTDIAGRDVPEISAHEIGKRARAAGVPSDVIDRILEVVHRGDLVAVLSRAFGWDPAALLGGQVTNQRLKVAVQFKSGDAEAAARSPLVVMAYLISEWVIRSTDFGVNGEIPTDAQELRSAASDHSGHVTLSSLSEWAWVAGIPVVPILGGGAFAAASWRVPERPVVVLKDSRPFSAFWLFDLAHELGHIALGHVRDRAVVDVESPAPGKSTDAQEEAANEFALDLLLPGHRELLEAVRQDARGEFMRFKFSVERVASRADVSVGLLGMVAAYELKEIGQYKDRWGSASNLARPEGFGRTVVRDILRKRIQPERLGKFEQEILTALSLSN